MAISGRFVALLAVGVALVVLLGTGWAGLVWVGVVAVAAAVDVLLAADPGRVRIERRMPRLARRGTVADGTLVVANDGGRPLRAVVRDLWEPSTGYAPSRVRVVVPAGERRTARVRFAPFRRGRRRTLGVAVRAFGPLGLAARQRVLPAPAELVVTPPFRSRRHLPSRLARLRELDGETTLQLRGHGTEFDSLREYVRGDDVRSIDWRATARRQDLVVRTWRPERDRRVVVVVDAGRVGAGRVEDEPRLDTFIESALLLGALAAAAGDRVDLVVLDDRVRERVAGATRTDVVQRFGETLSRAEPGLAATDWASVPDAVDAVTTSRAFVVLLSSLDSVGASGDLLAVLPRLTGRHTVVVTSITDPAVTDAARGRTEATALRGGPIVGPVARLQAGAVGAAGRDVHRRAAAERTLLDADGVADVARRAGAEVVRGVPADVPPLVADAYLRAKAAGRL